MKSFIQFVLLEFAEFAVLVKKLFWTYSNLSHPNLKKRRPPPKPSQGGNAVPRGPPNHHVSLIVILTNYQIIRKTSVNVPRFVLDTIFIEKQYSRTSTEFLGENELMMQRNRPWLKCRLDQDRGYPKRCSHYQSYAVLVFEKRFLPHLNWLWDFERNKL